MFKGGANVEIEGGKLSLEEQLALAEAAERAKQEAEAAEQKEREDAWNVFVPTLVKANISPLISPTGKRFMRRCERVN